MNITLSNVVASIPDDRDLIYQPRQGPFPDKCDLKPEVMEVEDQGGFNFCLDNATVSATEMLKPDMSGSRMFVSYNRRHIIESTSGNVGGSLRNAIRAAYHYGIPNETAWAYDAGLIDAVPTPDAYSQGLVRRITRYERITALRGWGTPTPDECFAFEQAVKSALSEKLPILIAHRIGVDFYSLTGPWQQMKMRPVSSDPTGNTWVGNHVTMIIGNDDTIQNPCPGQDEPGLWLDQNSWDKNWGDGGFCGYPKAALNLDHIESWIVRGFVDVLVNPSHPVAEVQTWYDLTNFKSDPKSLIYWAMDATAPKSFYGTVRDMTVATCNAEIAKL